MTNEIIEFRNQCRLSWRPPEKVFAEKWIPANVKTAPGSEYEGYYSYDVAPHTRGVLEAYDDDSVREIYLGWATRNMKTTTMIALMLFVAENKPVPMAFGSCDQASIERTVDEQIYPIAQACKPIAKQLPPLHKRSRKSIKFDRCRVRCAFGGSVASVAGYPAAIIFGSEWDKWKSKKSTEADPANSFRQRTKGYPFTYKAVLESTPSTLENSRIWEELHASRTDRREYFVPCPHCKEHQTLDFDQLKWDEGKGDKPDLELASKTSVYICVHCDKAIRSEDRAQMMRAGQWVSVGQKINKKGVITGEKEVPSQFVGFGPLSSLYSLLISGWDQIVIDWIKCGKDPDKIRDFYNSTLALPYDPKPETIAPHVLALRLCTEDKLGICPEWAVFLTKCFDVQSKAKGPEYPYQTCAWGRGGRGAVIDHGTVMGGAPLDHEIKKVSYPHIDGGPPLKVSWMLMDSGDGISTLDVYRICRLYNRLLPLKGSSHPFHTSFNLSPIGAAAKKQFSKASGTSKRDLLLQGVKMLLIVNTQLSQSWIHKIINGWTNAESDNWFSLPEELASQEAFLEDLLNEVAIEEFGEGGILSKRWVRKHNKPNDQRDLTRYNWACAELITNYGSEWWDVPTRESQIKSIEVSQVSEPEKKSNKHTQGGGRSWHKNRKRR